MSFYALRYLPHVPLNQRKHEHVDARYLTWAEAEDAREASPVRDLVEVVARGGRR